MYAFLCSIKKLWDWFHIGTWNLRSPKSGFLGHGHSKWPQNKLSLTPFKMRTVVLFQGQHICGRVSWHTCGARGQLWEAVPPFPPSCGFQGPTSCHQACSSSTFTLWVIWPAHKTFFLNNNLVFSNAAKLLTLEFVPCYILTEPSRLFLFSYFNY